MPIARGPSNFAGFPVLSVGVRYLCGSWRRFGAAGMTAAVLALVVVSSASAAPGTYTTRGAWRFFSAPKLHPPKLLTHGRTQTRRLAKGDFLLDNFPDAAISGPMTGQGGPLIVNRKLQPVWFQPVSTNLVSGDLQQETYQGEPVLVWWQGNISPTGATSRGEVIVVNQHYRRIATLTARTPWTISIHDAVISGSDIWVTAYRYVRHQNLKPYGGAKNGTVYDAGILEYDLATGKLLYTWDALNPGGTANLPLSASEQPASAAAATGGAWDAYHVNAVQVVGPGQILVSVRNTWAVYLVNTMTDKILWTLGGKHSSFHFGPGAAFQWQHDARMVGLNEVTLFDDNCCKQLPSGNLERPNGYSRGMVLKLDFVRRTASLVAAYPYSKPLVVGFLGSMQRLPDGAALVGWGSQPYFTEDTSSGTQLLDGVFPGKDQSYRALYSQTWVGTPYYRPHGAARNRHGRTTVYASWNGATEVSYWQVLGGSHANRLRVLARRGKNGFETAITLKKGTHSKFFEVRALNSRGKVIGSSRVFR